ncbi:leucine--tRNA ligase, partial [Candidatus Roizmanbacteria bacterium]|nr:leucine--tRNA ligase [Candidatus Roizmanbacteria bacterium]
KWQGKWRKDGLFSLDTDRVKKPYYALMMFPYPSAEGLHVGNMYAFTGADIFARLMRMQGYDVLEPIGLDGFGIHSENYALKEGRHPADLSKQTEKRFYTQLMASGNAFDWRRTVETYKPNYYKWTQWLFLQMFKKGLAYRKLADVNWCPSCKTVLADEQVVGGKCERCLTMVIKKELEQWFFKITKYANRLLKNLEKLDWSERIKIAQENWIGKSEGLLIDFDGIKVFTTRPDTTDGATFIVLSPEHELVKRLTTKEQKRKVTSYIEEAKKKSEQERIAEGREKTGVFTGSQVKNPVTKKKIPVWVADYVLYGYGTGAIMAVPDADERDKEFAKRFGLPIDKTSFKAKPKGERKVNYHLRDWLISRQRYWGPPIPIIYCRKCGTVPVPEKDLPVVLPYVKEFRPTGTGRSPLASIPSFVKAKCPKCGGLASRETDVSDTFLDSAWYFLRYPSTEFSDKPFDLKRTKKWLPVESYIGGAEHAVLHLLYSRFVTMVLNDMGYLDFDEPFTKFRAHGLLISEGAKMSKSKGNVVVPDEYIKEYGADTLRMYLMFLGPFDMGGDFRDEAIGGVYRFLDRVWTMSGRVDNKRQTELSKDDLPWLNKTIKKVGRDVENLKFNTAIAFMMEWLNYLGKKEKVSHHEYKTFLLLLAPFAPHVTEELWEKLGEKYSIHKQGWPACDRKTLVKEELNIPVQVNGRLRGVVILSANDISKDAVVRKALKQDSVKKHLADKKYKTVYIEGRILNFVTS